MNGSIELSAAIAATTGIRYYPWRAVRWDTSKAVENLRKHGVDFADAITVLEDPNRLEEIDDRFVYDEERIRVIGNPREGAVRGCDPPP